MLNQDSPTNLAKRELDPELNQESHIHISEPDNNPV